MIRVTHFRFYLQMAVVAATTYAGWVVVNRHLAGLRWDGGRAQEQAKRDAEFERIYGGVDVRILQFYSPSASLMEGDHATICYGVVNAKSVRMEPPVDGVSVSLNRCVAVAPEQDTRYTLIAEGNDGRTVTESFALTVRPDPFTLPSVTSFRIARTFIDRGRRVYLVSFEVRNAEEISIEPQAFPTLHRAPNGRFYAMPDKTTTYTLTVVEKKGRTASKQLTLEVPDS